jgi:Family of unknown function (DUF6932)
MSIAPGQSDGFMIPEFDDNGYLPPGVHTANLDDVAARFGQESELRRAQIDSLRWLVDLARRAGAQRLIVNGSFTTDVLEPNDVDCVLLVGSEFPREAAAEVELRDGLPFVDLHVVGAEDFDLFVNTIFGTDRLTVPKGVVEVLL